MNRETFIACVEREQEALRGFLLALCCGNKEEADDLAQDALVKAYLACSGFSDGGKFRSWLFKIAHNTFLSYKRSLKPTLSIDDACVQALPQSGSGEGASSDLYLALSMLPPKERSSITLFYLNGYNIKEIAAITEVSQDAVKQQLSRGRDKLRAILKIEN
ncbi:MAG: RNA polymerase sigma factor [Bacteroidaceae bacterium]|nr:RNA polymerase sigma factor [Bacteroidaceae bacterium]